MKKLGLILLLVFPTLVFAADACSPIVSTITTDSRNITCDASKRTATTFKTTSEIEVLKNDVCTVKCTEEILFSVDPIKNVLAGTGFNYPLYASGKRVCKAVYKYSDYETKIKKLVDEYSKLSPTSTAGKTKKNEITNYYELKKECDKFPTNSKYSFNGDIKLKLTTSEKVENIKYKFVQSDEYTNTVEKEEVFVANKACDYNETSVKCNLSDTTLESWTDIAYLNGKYTMSDAYLEQYTGKVYTTNKYDRCNAGDKYFTSMQEYTKPKASDKKDNGYSLELIANELGSNLSSSGKKWSLDVKCSYRIKNLIYPVRKPGTGGTDEDYELCGGNTCYQYRMVDLNEPFPNRVPAANWDGLGTNGKSIVYNVITSTKDSLSTMEKFRITLDRSKIRRVREYNKVNKYDTFNLPEMERSIFIIQNPDIVDRK